MRSPREFDTGAIDQLTALPAQTVQTAETDCLVSGVHFKFVMLNHGDELRDRIEARKHELLAKYNELKADTRREATEARARLKTRLDELELQIKDGWAKVSDDVRTKLNQWLDRRDHD